MFSHSLHGFWLLNISVLSQICHFRHSISRKPHVMIQSTIVANKCSIWLSCALFTLFFAAHDLYTIYINLHVTTITLEHFHVSIRMVFSFDFCFAGWFQPKWLHYIQPTYIIRNNISVTFCIYINSCSFGFYHAFPFGRNIAFNWQSN